MPDLVLIENALLTQRSHHVCRGRRTDGKNAIGLRMRRQIGQNASASVGGIKRDLDTIGLAARFLHTLLESVASRLIHEVPRLVIGADTMGDAGRHESFAGKRTLLEIVGRADIELKAKSLDLRLAAVYDNNRDAG